MPERITIADAARHVDETVEIPGWLYNLRKSGKIVFPILRDGTGLMQCVAVKSALPEELFEELKHLTQESSLIIRGRFAPRPVRPAVTNWTSKAPRSCKRYPKPIRIRSRPRNTGLNF